VVVMRPCLNTTSRERLVGETTQNRSGTDLLRDDELDYTFSGRPDNGCRSTDLSGCSIDDHAMALDRCCSTPPVQPRSIHDVDVQLCGSDHLNHTAPATHQIRRYRRAQHCDGA
jgi:hypothetical protein